MNPHFKTLSEDDFRLQQLWTEIVFVYSAKERFYHNLQHLNFMLDVVQPIFSEIEDKQMFLAALFYHDFVYDVSSTQNEEDSAQVAVNRLERLNWTSNSIEKVQQMIFSTKHHKPTNDADTTFLLDADIAILGASEKVYQKYARNIRKEYIQYPDAVYQQGRKAVLQHFLAKSTIFQSPYFQSQFEEIARVNLHNELLFYGRTSYIIPLT